ncbi:hypothetical protein [Pedobacter hartonius]|uniref:Uncharacterized protein n=1 Tax=Pedobacter hartonius TaxID=425514 RepID=A0A1H4HDL2_9SPHI|nr:hypothetical protein [Pedobacter hartonius]SEB19874.1 hypothetical protein SAMN05443550_1168 [Pedobacter hartonius]
MSKSWYAFIGSDPLDVLSYYRITIKHDCLCGTQICAIYATDNGMHPADPLSSNLQEYIKEALVTRMIQPAEPYNARKFVYLKH